MHHFPTVKELLETVLRQRDDDDDMTAIRATLLREYQHPTLLDLADTVVRYYAARPVETRNFDALEAKAVLAEHPAHEFFAHLSGYSTHRIHQTACSTRLPRSRDRASDTRRRCRRAPCTVVARAGNPRLLG